MARNLTLERAPSRQHAIQCQSAGRLARGLGWFSIGFGLAEVIMPRQLADWIGVPTRPLLIRLCGAREIAAGVGILAVTRPTEWLWARVAGDAMDMGLLASAYPSKRADTTRVTAAVAAVAGVTALDVYTARELSRGRYGTTSRARRVVKSIIVNRSPEECYNFWHNFQNLPRFMKHVESVEVLGERRSHWRVKAPGGGTVEWTAHIVEDRPNEVIAWRSVDGSADVHNSGSVRFQRAPGNRGTIVKVELQYVPPAGALGANIAKLFGEEPGQQVDDDLRAFKQIMETGEVLRSDASIHRGMHAAQPPREWSREQAQLSPV